MKVRMNKNIRTRAAHHDLQYHLKPTRCCLCAGPVVDKEGDVLSPPLSLLTYPPLSQYTNLVLTSFNQLRYAQPTL